MIVMKYFNLFILILFAQYLPIPVSAQTLQCDCYEICLKKITAKSGLVLRSKPSTNSEKITVIPYGEKVTVGYNYELEESVIIEGRKGVWVKTYYQGHKGFVFDGFLNKTPEYILLLQDYPIEWEKQTSTVPVALTPVMPELQRWDIYDIEEVPMLENKWIVNGTEQTSKMPDYKSFRAVPFFITGLPTGKRRVRAICSQRKESPVYPGQQETFIDGNKNYIIYATGTVKPHQHDPNHLYDFYRLLDYKLFLMLKDDEDKEQTQILYQGKNIPSSMEGNLDISSLHWVGDLDDDKIPDIIISIQGYYMMYLSSEADEGYMLKLVHAYLQPGC